MVQLLEGLVPGLPGAVSQQIVTRAEGVPLYAVEIVRMLLDDGRLVADEGRYRIAGKIDGFDVPATLHALVNARLDALPGEERSLLQDAAVLGQSFTIDGISALRSQTEVTLKRKLDRSKPLTLLDVRQPAQVDQDRRTLPHAVWIPPDEVERRHAELPADREVIAYCA